MKYPPVNLDEEMVNVVIQCLTACVERSCGGLRIVAAAIEPTHMHLLIPETGRNIDQTVKWIADQTTKSIHRLTRHRGPVWTKGSWCSHINRQEHWEHAILYIDEHNVRAGRGSRPYPFLAEVEI